MTTIGTRRPVISVAERAEIASLTRGLELLDGHTGQDLIDMGAAWIAIGQARVEDERAGARPALRVVRGGAA